MQVILLYSKQKVEVNNFIKNLVLSKEDGSTVSSQDKFPISLVVFMMTIGLVIGSFLNKIF